MTLLPVQEGLQTPAGKSSIPRKDGFASLFDSPLWSGPAQSFSSQDSFSFGLQGGSHDENAVPSQAFDGDEMSTAQHTT